MSNGQETVIILSKAASDKWKDERNYRTKLPNKDRDLDVLSEIAERQHKLMFPEYKYSPKQKNKKEKGIKNALIIYPLPIRRDVKDCLLYLRFEKYTYE